MAKKKRYYNPDYNGYDGYNRNGPYPSPDYNGLNAYDRNAPYSNSNYNRSNASNRNSPYPNPDYNGLNAYNRNSPVPNTVHGIYRMREHEQYAGYENSKREMARDGAMIHEDRMAPCLLPTNVIDKYWPKARGYYMAGGISDLFQGVQEQLSQDGQDRDREYFPKKY